MHFPLLLASIDSWLSNEDRPLPGQYPIVVDVQAQYKANHLQLERAIRAEASTRISLTVAVRKMVLSAGLGKVCQHNK